MSGPRFRIFCPACLKTWVSLTIPHTRIICMFCSDIGHEKEVFLVPKDNEVHYFKKEEPK